MFSRLSVLPKGREYLIAFLVVLAILSAQAARQDDRYPVNDEFRYLTAGLHLAMHGVFAGVDPLTGAAAPAMNEAPVTPFVLAGLMRADDRLMGTITCIIRANAEKRKLEDACRPDYGIFIPWQTLMMALSVSLIWLIARNCGGTRVHCWLALCLGLLSKQYGYYLPFFLTEPNLIFLLSVFFWGVSHAWGVYATTRDARHGLLVAGFALGLCTLTREGYSALGVASAAAVFLACRWLPGKTPAATAADQRSFVPAVCYVAGFILAITPWVVRNQLQLGVLGIVDGHGSHVIVERIAYNMMTWREWCAAWVYWLPDFGDQLGQALFGQEAVERLDWYSRTSFYKIGNGELQVKIAQELAAAGGSKLSYVLKTYVLGDLFKHVSVSLVLSWRGLWIGQYFGLFGQFLSIFGFIILMQRGHLRLALGLVAPAIFMVGLHGFVSVSINRYNVAMLPYLSVLSAFAIIALAGKVQGRFKTAA